MRIPIRTRPALQVGEPAVVFEGVFRTNAYGNPSYDVAPDGERFLMILPGSKSTPRLGVALDWQEVLPRIGLGQKPQPHPTHSSLGCAAS